MADFPSQQLSVDKSYKYLVMLRPKIILSIKSVTHHLKIILSFDYKRREFHHENLVKFHGICTQEGPLLIVTELMPRG